MKRFLPILLAACAAAGCAFGAAQAPVPLPEFQPLAAQAQRVVETLEYLGSPLTVADRKVVLDAAKGPGGEKSVTDIMRVLDRYVLYQVHINPESRVKIAPGAARPELAEAGWRTFLVKVTNEAGVTAPL